jgi:hypothetical protein
MVQAVGLMKVNKGFTEENEGKRDGTNRTNRSYENWVNREIHEGHENFYRRKRRKEPKKAGNNNFRFQNLKFQRDGKDERD